mmetsp:Transcript_12965/g.16372  ORF Transcript_12965/g.16372 Transcript_12965/m.16372 type:complete len:427 (+) Transcript_12965:108-1388(+)
MFSCKKARTLAYIIVLYLNMRLAFGFHHGFAISKASLPAGGLGRMTGPISSQSPSTFARRCPSTRLVALTATLLAAASSVSEGGLALSASNKVTFKDDPKFTKLRYRPKVFFVLGGPGAGKGTQCEKMVEEYGFCHLSAGDLLRKERESGSKDGQLIDEFIREGKIVPVQISLGLLRKAMQEAPQNRFLIDGFPRNWDNVQGWNTLMEEAADVESVIFYDCPENIMEQRLLNRGLTSGRTDDNLESARKRFQTYMESTIPVVDHYEKQGIVARIPGYIGDPDKVFERTKSVVEPLISEELINLTQELLDAISEGDYQKYQDLCDESLTAFEPEALAGLVEGLDFHKFYFDKDKGSSKKVRAKSTITSPHVRLMGKSAVVTYQRISQFEDLQTGSFSSISSVETRIWQLKNGLWKNVHFHRSNPSSS